MGAILIPILLFFFVSFAPAQSPLASRAFDEATRLANAGEFGKAAKGYRVAIAASDEDTGDFAVKLRYNLGVCYYRTAQLTAAASELKAAIRLSGGEHQGAYYALGMTESALENWPAARAAFLKAIELRPEDGEAWFDLAFVYLAEHDYDRAAAAFRKSIENRSVDAALGHNNLGVIMAINHDLDGAEKAFEDAINLSDGRLIMARTNLDICRSLRIGRKQLIAGISLKFSGRAVASRNI